MVYQLWESNDLDNERDTLTANPNVDYDKKLNYGKKLGWQAICEN